MQRLLDIIDTPILYILIIINLRLILLVVFPLYPLLFQPFKCRICNFLHRMVEQVRQDRNNRQPSNRWTPRLNTRVLHGDKCLTGLCDSGVYCECG